MMKLYLEIFGTPIPIALFLVWLCKYTGVEFAYPDWVALFMFYALGVFVFFTGLEGWHLWRGK